MSSGESHLTIAICTRDRPDWLRRCLTSIAEAKGPIWEILVSDDGTDPRTDEVVEELKIKLPELQLIRGPRLGLAANRNACIDAATGDYLLFLDDDARLGEDFLACAMPHARADVLVTGFERQGSFALRPKDLDFLGFARLPSGPQRRSLCMNATIFPTAFLRRTGFDEFFRCSYQEADIALAALRWRMTIVGIEAANLKDGASEMHLGDRRNAIRSRAYLGVRRHREYEPNALRALSFPVLGLLNAAGHGLRMEGIRGGIEAGTSFLVGLVSAFGKPQRRRASLEAPQAPTLTVGVVIPTWRRPEQLRACLDGILRLDPAPDQVVVVRRSEDLAAAQVIASLSRAVDECVVDQPGQLAAMELGSRRTRTELVAFTDDDAVPRIDWLRYLLAPYRDQAVGAVGGRDVVHHPDGIIRGAAERVGTISVLGRVVGRHHLGVGVARQVDHLKGANMSYRRGLLRFPVGLRGEGAQVHNELAMCLTVADQGKKVVYDPRAQVDHYPGERFDEDRRTGPTQRAAANAAFNESFILFSLRPRNRHVRLAYMVLIGTHGSPGLVRAAVAAARGEDEIRGRLRMSLLAQREAWSVLRLAPLAMRAVNQQAFFPSPSILADQSPRR
jgi:glycosyltransferase involved in cell wall biosynthesis